MMIFENRTATVLRGVLLGLLVTANLSLAEDTQPVERVTMKDGKMWASRGGQTAVIQKSIQMPLGILVMTNGTYTVNQGKVRHFKEGQVLDAHGMLTSPDGSIIPVFDHVIMKAGRPRIMKDGAYALVKTATALGNGAQVLPTGFIRKKDGRVLQLLDGQLFKLDGTTVPAKDTITLKHGKVVVQKDGSLLKVSPGRSLMMNDGTKVFGNGTLVFKDGTRKVLTEGETITVEGVAVRR